MPKTRRHLEGLRVIDFSAVFAGPICARFLADNGASVIKVEPPVGGDVIRGPEGYSRLFNHFNAGKRGIALNLAMTEAQEIAKELISNADVVIENYRPGIMKKFGLDYESLKEAFPKLVYCSISGFGQTGPFAEKAAYAPIAHAASGFDHVFSQSQPGTVSTPPVWSIMVADMLTGAYANAALQTALLGRERTGLGDFVDVTMMESMMMLIPGQIQNAQVPGAPATGGFFPIEVLDGHVMVCIVSNKNMETLCRAISRPDILDDERFKLGQRHHHISEFIAQIEAWTATRSGKEVEEKFNDAGVPCSGYSTPADLFNHPQLTHRGSFTAFADDASDYLIQNAPFQFGGAQNTPSFKAPQLGEHTNEILFERFGYESAKLDELRLQGIIGG